MSRGTPSEAQLATRFQPGNNRNPLGRPKKVLTPEQLFEESVKRDLKSAAKEFSAEALMTLVDIMRNPKASDQHRINAATQLLDRGHGKPQNQTEITVGVYDRFSESELVRLITGKYIEGKVEESSHEVVDEEDV
jgi:hypothetical protein